MMGSTSLRTGSLPEVWELVGSVQDPSSSKDCILLDRDLIVPGVCWRKFQFGGQSTECFDDHTEVLTLFNVWFLYPHLAFLNILEVFFLFMNQKNIRLVSHHLFVSLDLKVPHSFSSAVLPLHLVVSILTVGPAVHSLHRCSTCIFQLGYGFPCSCSLPASYIQVLENLRGRLLWLLCCHV